MIITIDGFVGTGKSSISKELAKRFRFYYLSTGAIYRALTLQIIQTTTSKLISQKEIAFQANKIISLNSIDFDIKLGPILGGVIIRDQDLRLKVINENVTKVASLVFVREFVNMQVRKIISNYNFIIEGRDTGLVIFPKANAKFYFVRNEIQEKFIQNELGSLDNINNPFLFFRKRDIDDINSGKIPFRKATDAYIYYPFNYSFLECVDFYEEIIRCRENFTNKFNQQMEG